jgi:hypothetical protein
MKTGQETRIGWRSAVLLLLVPVILVVWGFSFHRLDEHVERRFRARFGGESPNIFFNSRIRVGMTAEEVATNVPPADRVKFFQMEDSSIVQQFLYTRPLGADYQVNAVFADKRIVGVEFDDRDLGKISPLSEAEARGRLR